jgi:hypothetical protein
MAMHRGLMHSGAQSTSNLLLKVSALRVACAGEIEIEIETVSYKRKATGPEYSKDYQCSREHRGGARGTVDLLRYSSSFRKAKTK